MDRRPLLLLAVFFALHLGILGSYGHLKPDRMVVRGIDPVGYYAWFHSPWFDGDLNFRNQYALLGEGHVPLAETPTGRVGNVFSAGPALALAPMFLAADGLARLSGAESDGLGHPHHAAGFLGLTLYGGVALLLLAIWCGRHFGPWPGAWAALFAWGGTTLLYYTAPLALMPHAIGAAAATLFLIACDRRGAGRPVGALLAGAALGAAMLARWQNALFVIYPLALSLTRWRASSERKGMLLAESRYWLTFSVGAVVAFAPQLIGWTIVYGNPVLIPQGSGFLRFLRPEVFQVLFSMERGLFTWTPITLIGVGGLLAARGAVAVRAVALGLIFLAQLYLNSTVFDWDASWGFGMRRFTEMAPVFAFGLGALLTRWDRREWRRAAVAFGLVFVVWNELFIFQYVCHLISWDAPLTWHEYAGDKFHLARSLQRRLWHNEAQLELQAGQYEEALASIEQARQYDAQHDDIFILKAVILESMGEFDQAEAALEQARELRPENPHLDYLSGRIRGAATEGGGDEPAPAPGSAPPAAPTAIP